VDAPLGKRRRSPPALASGPRGSAEDARGEGGRLEPPGQAVLATVRGEHQIANLEIPRDRLWVRPYTPDPTPCPWCKRPFIASRRDQHFCSARCGSKASDRETQRARWVYRSLYWWLKTKKPEHLVYVLRMVRGWVRADEVEGKGAPLEPDYRVPWTGRQPRKGSRGEFHEVDLAIRGLEVLDIEPEE
jgi:hypothetical protein